MSNNKKSDLWFDCDGFLIRLHQQRLNIISVSVQICISHMHFIRLMCSLIRTEHPRAHYHGEHEYFHPVRLISPQEAAWEQHFSGIVYGHQSNSCRVGILYCCNKWQKGSHIRGTGTLPFMLMNNRRLSPSHPASSTWTISPLLVRSRHLIKSCNIVDRHVLKS